LIFKKIIQRKRTIKPQIIYCHWGVSFSYLGKKLAQHFKVPFIIDVHEDIDNIRKIPLIMPYYKDMLKTCNRIIVHSIRTRNNIMKLGVNFEKITLVPLGVDEIFLDNNITEIRYKKKNENIKLITVANLENKCKRIDVLINAVKKLIDIGYSIQLTIVGDGILKNVLKKLADNLAIKDHVLFTGNLSSDQIKRLLLMNDIFIMPSNRESFGIALIEALALGLVVVASDNVGAVSDLELFGINLVVFKSDDIEELTEKIANIINNFNYYKQFIKGNSIITKRIYSWENHSKQICDLIDKEILIGRL
jgi:glycosyltransferase involved in cell wall biosynthesis